MRILLVPAFIFTALLLAPAHAAENLSLDWFALIDTDEITDQTTANVLNIRRYESAEFACNAEGAAMFLVENGPADFGRGDSRQVTIRIDDREPFTMTWSNYRSDRIGARITGEPAINLARQLLSGEQRFVFRSYDRTATFGMGGARESFEDAFAACGIDVN